MVAWYSVGRVVGDAHLLVLQRARRAGRVLAKKQHAAARALLPLQRIAHLRVLSCGMTMRHDRDAGRCIARHAGLLSVDDAGPGDGLAPVNGDCHLPCVCCDADDYQRPTFFADGAFWNNGRHNTPATASPFAHTILVATVTYWYILSVFGVC